MKRIGMILVGAAFSVAALAGCCPVDEPDYGRNFGGIIPKGYQLSTLQDES